MTATLYNLIIGALTAGRPRFVAPACPAQSAVMDIYLGKQRASIVSRLYGRAKLDGIDGDSTRLKSNVAAWIQRKCLPARPPNKDVGD